MLDSEIKVFIRLSRVGFGLGTNLFRDCSIVVMNRVMSLCYAQEYGALIIDIYLSGLLAVILVD